MRAAFLTVAFGLMLASPAWAGKIDLSAQTCRQFVEMISSDPDEVKAILIWLDAYYRDDDEPAVIDTDKFVENARKLGQYCKDNPTIGLITATDALFDK